MLIRSLIFWWLWIECFLKLFSISPFMQQHLLHKLSVILQIVTWLIIVQFTLPKSILHHQYKHYWFESHLVIQFLLLTTLIMFLMTWERLCFLSKTVRLVFVSNFSCKTHYVSYKLFLINHNECMFTGNVVLMSPDFIPRQPSLLIGRSVRRRANRRVTHEDRAPSSNHF